MSVSAEQFICDVAPHVGGKSDVLPMYDAILTWDSCMSEVLPTRDEVATELEQLSCRVSYKS